MRVGEIVGKDGKTMSMIESSIILCCVFLFFAAPILTVVLLINSSMRKEYRMAREHPYYAEARDRFKVVTNGNYFIAEHNMGGKWLQISPMCDTYERAFSYIRCELYDECWRIERETFATHGKVAQPPR